MKKTTLEELHITSPSGKTEHLYINDFVTQDELQSYATKLHNLILYGMDYFYIESLQDGNIITFEGYYLGEKSNQIEYSINNKWNSLSGVSQLTLNSGEKLYLRCIDGDICRTNDDNQNAIFDTTYEFNLGGNIETLLFDCTQLFENYIYVDYSMYSFFRNTKVVNSSKLILPATSLVSNCYANMFRGCETLTTAPELPATTLADFCYSGMFYNCTALAIAPELPATTLAGGCYREMFDGCTSLTTSPELPATTLVDWCYQYMFQGCTSLNYIKCLATNKLNNSTSSWVAGVSNTGTFVKHPDATWSTGESGIPTGWTVEDYVES